MAPRSFPGAERYRGEVARKSSNRGGATRARSATPRPAGPGQARSAKTGTSQAGPAKASPAKAGTVKAGPAKASTAQLTAPTATEAASPTTSAYPGQRLGLPERGPGSVASMPRRVLALFIDWLLSLVIAYWLTHSEFWTIAVFAVEVYILTALTGTTVGKRLAGIRVIRLSGGPVGFGWALVRTAILLTVVPPLLTDRDLRGLHDRASDTVVVRL
jgi:RDD family protein